MGMIDASLIKNRCVTLNERYIQGGNSRMRRVPVVYPISTYIYHGEDVCMGQHYL